MVPLTIYETQDKRFHQKCFANADTLQQIGLKLGQFLSIQSESKLVICSLWLDNYLPDNSLFLTSNTWTDLKSDICKAYCIKVLYPLKASKLLIDVILTNTEEVCVKNRNTTTKHETGGYCFNILKGLCFTKNVVINCENSKFAQLVGIYKIVVKEVFEPNSNEELASFVISHNTVIHIREIHSKEWYAQMTSSKSLIKPGGVDGVLKLLQDLVKFPWTKKQMFKDLGVKPPHGILLRGPPGCGKTSLVRYLAHEEKIFLLALNGPEIFGPLPGETEENLRKLFTRAKLFSKEGPCMLFIDEIDSICPKGVKTENVNTARATSQFLMLMDSLTGEEEFLVVGATNRPSSLDPALRRPGRLDREVRMLAVEFKTFFYYQMISLLIKCICGQYRFHILISLSIFVFF